MNIDPTCPEPNGFVLRVAIPGPLPSLNPTYKARAVSTRGRRPFAHLYKSATIKAWQARVEALADKAALGRRPCFDGPVVLEAHLRFARESSLAPNLAFGDIDGPVKALLDALSGIAYQDDVQVVRLIVDKQLDRHNPGVLVFVSETR